MNCVLFAKMDQVFSKENKTLKKYWKIGEKYWKSQGILSVRKSGNPVGMIGFLILILCEKNFDLEEIWERMDIVTDNWLK